MHKTLCLLPLLFAAPAFAQQLTPQEAEMKAHVAFLASDEMKGRQPGTPEFDIAARYVATQMAAAGLRPAGDQGDWYQKVPLVTVQASEKGSMTLTRGSTTAQLGFGTDFVSASNPRHPSEAVSGDVVFVGYGVVDPATGRDDYKGLDVRGKVVAVLFGAPAGLPSEVRAHYGDADTKMRTAAAHGAAGYVTIESEQLRQVISFDYLASHWDMPRMFLAEADGSPQMPADDVLPLGYLSAAGAAKLFAGSPIRWDAVARADKAGKPLPRGALGVRVEVRQPITTGHIVSENVVGRLDGADPALKDQVVVLSAHLDHVGVGKPDATGDTIYNGAMDNAAGTASMLEVAKSFQRSGKPPRRSILFVAVTAEEKGLLGSQYFAEHPTVPAASVVANVNLDMPVLTYKFEDIVVYGADRTSIGPTVARVAGAEGVSVTPDPAPEQAAFVRSDHYSFVQQGVPAVSLEPGPKGPGKAALDDFNEHHYHQPSDQVTLPIDWASGVRFVRLNYEIARAIADDDQRPRWNKGDFFGTLYHGYGAQ